MNPDAKTAREDAISFGQIDARAEEERRENEQTAEVSDVSKQGISNRPGDVDGDEDRHPDRGGHG